MQGTCGAPGTRSTGWTAAASSHAIHFQAADGDATQPVAFWQKVLKAHQKKKKSSAGRMFGASRGGVSGPGTAFLNTPLPPTRDADVYRPDRTIPVPFFPGTTKLSFLLSATEIPEQRLPPSPWHPHALAPGAAVTLGPLCPCGDTGQRDDHVQGRTGPPVPTPGCCTGRLL